MRYIFNSYLVNKYEVYRRISLFFKHISHKPDRAMGWLGLLGQGAHHVDAHLHGALRIQHAGRHDGAVLGED